MVNAPPQALLSVVTQIPCQKSPSNMPNYRKISPECGKISLKFCQNFVPRCHSPTSQHGCSTPECTDSRTKTSRLRGATASRSHSSPRRSQHPELARPPKRCLGALALLLSPGFRLVARWNRLVEENAQKKRGKTGVKWARYGLKRVKESGSPGARAVAAEHRASDRAARTDQQAVVLAAQPLDEARAQADGGVAVLRRAQCQAQSVLRLQPVDPLVSIWGAE